MKVQVKIHYMQELFSRNTIYIEGYLSHLLWSDTDHLTLAIIKKKITKANKSGFLDERQANHLQYEYQ